jgi:hypothetical protein
VDGCGIRRRLVISGGIVIASGELVESALEPGDSGGGFVEALAQRGEFSAELLDGVLGEGLAFFEALEALGVGAHAFLRGARLQERGSRGRLEPW